MGQNLPIYFRAGYFRAGRSRNSLKWRPRVVLLERKGSPAPPTDEIGPNTQPDHGTTCPWATSGRLSDAFLSATERFADRVAFVMGSQTLRYAELGRHVRRVAQNLVTSGQCRSGTRVAVMLENGPEYIAAYYGVLAAGGVVVPLPANVEWNRLERIAEICNVDTILTHRSVVVRRDEMPLEHCERLDLDVPSDPFVPAVQPVQVGDQSLAMVMFTSGSSGDPKGVTLSDQNLLANTKSICEYLPITSTDRALAVLPFYHAFGLSIMQTHLLTGAALVVAGNMAFPNTVVDAMERHEVTTFSAVPEGYYSLLTMSDLGQRPLPHLRYMTVAGGALRPDSVVEVSQRIAPAEFYVMYGQTEASARLAYLPADHAQQHPNSIGCAIPGVELRLVGPDGSEPPPHEVGELCARGANVMLGYWGDPQGTEEVVRDGWLQTGDLASRDEQGFYYVKARKNDLVKVQGYRVHPREVEEALACHLPDLRVIVVPYQYQGSIRLALFGITNQADEHSAEDIRRLCARLLPRHKTPSHVEVLTQAPLNASMKLDRNALRRLAELKAGGTSSQPAEARQPNRLSA